MDDPWESWDYETYARLIETARECPTYMSSLLWELQNYIDGDVDNFDLHECALWTGETPSAGRGQLHGRHYINGLAIRPYRLLYDLRFGLQPQGIVLRHTCCSHGQCCNTHHLEPGSRFDNFVDRYSQTLGYKGAHISEVLEIYKTGTNPAPERIPEKEILRIMNATGWWAHILSDTPEALKERIYWGLPAPPPTPLEKDARYISQNGRITKIIDI